MCPYDIGSIVGRHTQRKMLNEINDKIITFVYNSLEKQAQARCRNKEHRNTNA